VFALVWKQQRWIAINCRNLWTMEIDRSRHFSLYEMYADEFARHQMFAFSWIDSVDQRHEYEGKYDGVLIGTSLVKDFLTRSQ
jgi:indole-3-glycerol phosphate synthase